MKKNKLITVLTVLTMTAGLAAGLCACGDKKDDQQTTPHTHSYGETQYSWADKVGGGYTCTASKTCSGCAATVEGHTVSETVDAVAGEDTATHTDAGSITYTATFTNSEFGTKTREVSTSAKGHTWAAEPGYSWEKVGNDWKCTATLRCTANDSGVITDTVTATYSTSAAEVCDAVVDYIYTATFADTRLGSDTKTIKDVTVEHDYGDWKVTTAPTDSETGVSERVCSRNEGHKDVKNDVPVLTDSSWTKTVKNATANYNEPAYEEYTSVYGTVKVITAAKLKAPYDSSKYVAIEVKLSDEGTNKACETDAWAPTNGITVNEVGEATPGGFPFQDNMKITMVNATTGEIRIDVTRTNGDDNGSYSGYVDMTTGVILFSYTSETTQKTRYFVMLPFEDTAPEKTAVKASEWTGGIAITAGGVNMCVVDGSMHMGVSFKSAKAEGDNVAAEAAYDAAKLYIFEGETQIAGFAKNKEGVLTATDGHEGTYGDVTLDGVGGATYSDKENLTYQWVGSESVLFTIGNNDDYYGEVAPTSYEITRPKVTLTITSAKPAVHESAELTTYEVYKNVKAELPAVTTADETAFIGWYLDADFDESAEGHIFTKNETVYLRWGHAITVIMHHDDSTTASLTAAEGMTIKELKAFNEIKDWTYNVNDVEGKYFDGWYADADFNTPVLDTAGIVAADKVTYTVHIYAKWTVLPVYYGTHKGRNTWSKSSGGNKDTNLVINEKGVISGCFTGTVVSYNEETQLLTWENSSHQTYYMVVDSVSGIIITGDNTSKCTNPIDPDLDTWSSEYPTATFGLQKGSSYDIRFVDVVNKCGTPTILFYGNKIYANIVVTDVHGNVLSAATMKDATNVIVKDKTTNDEILAVCSKTGVKFDSNQEVKDLDAFRGTFTCTDKDDLVLLGNGEFTWNGKSGTYTATEEGASYGYDMYVVEGNKNVEYYELTLDTEENTYTVNMPMVTITYVIPESQGEHTAPQAAQANKNIGATFATLSEAGYTIVGWYKTYEEDEFSDEKENGFVVTEDLTVYGKVAAAATVTVVYEADNNANYHKANDVFNKYVGWVFKIEDPVSKMKFEGWYTTEDYQEGTEWTCPENGLALTATLTIYAKWSKASDFYNNYVGAYLIGTSSTDQTSSLGDRPSSIIKIGTEGTATGVYPFSGAITVTYTDEAKGEINFASGSSNYSGYFDKETGIMVIDYDTTAGLSTVCLLSPYETGSFYSSKIKSSYWNSGASRSIVYTYTDEDGQEQVMKIFVYDNKVYFNVSFKDAATGGNDVAGNKCHEAFILYAFDSEGTLITKVAQNNSSKMVAPDGSEGVYTVEDGTDTITLNGAGKAMIGDVIYKNFTKISADEGLDGTYSVTVKVEGKDEYREYVINVTNKTYTVTVPTVHITYDLKGKTPTEAVPAVDANKTIGYELPTPTTEGFIFRGWYTDTDCTTAVTLTGGKYVPTAEATLYAKWDKAITVTIVYGNGMEQEVKNEYYANDTVTVAFPANKDGKYAAGWYTDENCTEGNEWTSGSKPTDDLTIYCKWEVAHELAGTASGAEIYGSSDKDNDNPGSASSKTVVIDNTGKVASNATRIGNKSVVMNNDGTFSAGNYFGAADLLNGVYAYNDSENGNEFKNDIHVLILGKTGVSITKANVVRWNEKTTYLIKATYTGGSMYIFVTGNKIYGNVQLTAVDGAGQTVENPIAGLLVNGTVVTIKSSTGNHIVTVGRVNDVIKGSDGLANTYTNTDSSAALASITLNGYGSVTAGTDSGSYTVNEGKISFVLANRMYVVTLKEGAPTFTQELDGYQGEYTMPDGTTKINLDGYGAVTGTTKTYVVNGTTINIYDGNSFDAYGINVSDKTLAAKTIVAGMKFIHSSSSSRYVEFADNANYEGTIYLGQYYLDIKFGGASGYDPATHKFSLVVTTQDRGNYCSNGDTFVFDYDATAGTLTFKYSESTIHPRASVNITEYMAEGAVFKV